MVVMVAAKVVLVEMEELVSAIMAVVVVSARGEVGRRVLMTTLCSHIFEYIGETQKHTFVGMMSEKNYIYFFNLC